MPFHRLGPVLLPLLNFYVRPKSNTGFPNGLNYDLAQKHLLSYTLEKLEAL